ncbi:wd repeat domain-containing protein [Colletotrichum incanum]|uniref:Wd repeat domain-containing protein n=1 Tax=Colletotrichum incanum TaxID=1573173 RepID=A0A166ZPQ5_COLIC|nr:wd repeat domain-containing protein [Colletotrichum incanum]
MSAIGDIRLTAGILLDSGADAGARTTAVGSHRFDNSPDEAGSTPFQVTLDCGNIVMIRRLIDPPHGVAKCLAWGTSPKSSPSYRVLSGDFFKVQGEKSLVVALNRIQIQDEDSSGLNIIGNSFFKDPKKPTDPAVLDDITDLKNLTVSCKSLYSLLLPVLYGRSGIEDDWYALRWASARMSITIKNVSTGHFWSSRDTETGDIQRRHASSGSAIWRVLNHKNHGVVKYPLSRNADINLEDYNWIAPLHVVSRYGVRRCSMVELLLNYGADVTKTGPQGWTPLHLTCWRPRWTSVAVDPRLFGRRSRQSGDHEAMRPVARMLIEAGADLKAQMNSSGSCGSPEPPRSGLTPLELALRCQNDTMVKFLREQECKSLNI